MVSFGSLPMTFASVIAVNMMRVTRGSQSSLGSDETLPSTRPNIGHMPHTKM